MCFVAEPAGVIPGVGPGRSPGVQSLVGRLWVQDKVGHARRPRIRHAIFKPAKKMNM